MLYRLVTQRGWRWGGQAAGSSAKGEGWKCTSKRGERAREDGRSAEEVSNEGNERGRRAEDVETVKQRVRKTSKDEMRKVLK